MADESKLQRNASSRILCGIVRQIVAQHKRLTQQSLFTDLDLRQIRHSSLGTSNLLEMSLDSLRAWKQRMFQYQQHIIQNKAPAQGSLFSLCTEEMNVERIDPFRLKAQNIEFWRSPADEPGLAALYFVIDHELPLLLYVGETCQANQRWKGVHDCKRYVRNYIAAHRIHHLAVSVSIGFWPHAPEQTRARQRMELELIRKWRSPFNKENWKHWGTPFIWGKTG
jgi:hypothetical protein